MELGKLLLASKKNDNNNLKIEDIKKNASNNLVLLLLINKPINKESPIDDKRFYINIIEKQLSLNKHSIFIILVTVKER